MVFSIKADNIPTLAGNFLIYRWNNYIVQYNIITEQIILEDNINKYDIIYSKNNLLYTDQHISLNIKDHMLYFNIPQTYESIGVTTKQQYRKIYDNYVVNIEYGKCTISHLKNTILTELIYYDDNVINTIIPQDIFRIAGHIHKNTHDNIIRIVEDDYIYKCWTLHDKAIVTLFSMIDNSVYNIIYKYNKNSYNANYHTNDLIVTVILKQDIMKIKIALINHDNNKISMYKGVKNITLKRNMDNIYVAIRGVRKIVYCTNIIDCINHINNDIMAYYDNII